MPRQRISPMRIVSRTLSVILALSIAFILSSPLLPCVAYADDTEEIMAAVRAIRTSIDSAQNEYLASVQKAAEYEGQCQATKAQMEETQRQLSERQSDLHKIMVDEYKQPIAATFLDVITGATGLDQVLNQIEYTNRVVEKRTRTTEEIAQLAEQLAEAMESLEAKQSVAEQISLDAEAAKSAWQGRLDEMRPQIKELRTAYFEKVANTSGSSQLDAALSYLEDIDGYTQEQEAILKAAYSTGYAGSNYCERWVERVFANAGVDHGNFMSANAAARDYLRDDDLESIPVGALVYGSGTSVPYGHVGICVAAGTGNRDALILDNEGSRSKTAVPLHDWESWQTAHSSVFGQSGLYGWGYPDSIALAPVAN